MLVIKSLSHDMTILALPFLLEALLCSESAEADEIPTLAPVIFLRQEQMSVLSHKKLIEKIT
jgi:hypothetical protein